MRRMFTKEEIVEEGGGGVEELDPSTIATTGDGTVDAPEYTVRSAFKLGELYAIVLDVTKPPSRESFLVCKGNQLMGEYLINGSSPISWSEEHYLVPNQKGTIIFLGVPFNSYY